jgi:hypothetical protein
MKKFCPVLIAGLLGASASAWGQTSIERAPDPGTGMPADPGMRGHPDSSVKTPRDPGISTLPDSSGDSPTNSGIVKVPPSTGPEPVVRPPANVDPGITAPTDDIDKKNRQKSEEKKDWKY